MNLRKRKGWRRIWRKRTMNRRSDIAGRRRWFRHITSFRSIQITTVLCSEANWWAWSMIVRQFPESVSVVRPMWPHRWTHWTSSSHFLLGTRSASIRLFRELGRHQWKSSQKLPEKIFGRVNGIWQRPAFWPLWRFLMGMGKRFLFRKSYRKRSRKNSSTADMKKDGKSEEPIWTTKNSYMNISR